MVNKKVCENCKHCENQKIIATCQYHGIVTGDAPAAHCRWVEAQIVTNGDVLQRYSRCEMSEFLALHAMCEFCPAETEHCGQGNNLNECRKAWQRWLDLPAEGEDAND
jgi:hypothetical protein